MKFFLSAPILALLVPSGSAQDRITSEQFKAGLESGAYDMVLDVRTDAERAAGFIPGTIHIPIDGFEENPFFDKLMGTSCMKECATIVAHCSVGGRAGVAIESLINLGFTGTLINGLGTNQWVDAGFALTTDEADAVLEPVCATTDICADSMGSMNGDSMGDMGSMNGDSMSDMNGDSSMSDMGSMNGDSMEEMNGDSMSDMNGDSMSDMGSMEETETGESESMTSGVASTLDAFGAVLVAMATLFAVA